MAREYPETAQFSPWDWHGATSIQWVESQGCCQVTSGAEDSLSIKDIPCP